MKVREKLNVKQIVPAYMQYFGYFRQGGKSYRNDIDNLLSLTRKNYTFF